MVLDHNSLYRLINSRHFQRNEKFERDQILHLTNDCIIILFALKKDKKTKIVVKKVSPKSKLLSNNSFCMGRFVTNKVKSRIQNFRYVYGYEIYRNQQVLYLEYIRGRTLKDFLHTNMYNSDKNKVKLFHNFLLQILLSLEYIQDKYRFTHYDLHIENIMISPCEHLEPFVFKLSYKTVKLKNIGYVVYFIDYDFSTASLLKTPSHLKKIIKYGFTGIFLSGTDILRLFFSIKKKVESCDDYFGLAVKNFINYVFQYYFQIDFDPGDSTSIILHEKMYYCMINQKQIFYTPLSLFYFLYDNQSNLNIDKKNFLSKMKNDFTVNETIYIPRLTSSKDAIEIFIRKYHNNFIIKNHFDTYISRIVFSLKELLEFFEKNNIKEIEVDPKIQNVKYLQ